MRKEAFSEIFSFQKFPAIWYIDSPQLHEAFICLVYKMRVVSA